MNAMAYLLLDDYNRYRSQTVSVRSVQKVRNIRVKPLNPTPERLQALLAMAHWAVARSFDPRWWLYTMFRGRKWTRPPAFDALVDEALIPVYRQWHRSRGGAPRPKRLPPQFDPRVEIAPSVEVRKREYIKADQASRCMALMANETFGYHPQSVVCRSCPLAEPCTTALRQLAGPEIVAERQPAPVEGTYNDESAVAPVARAADG